MMTIENHYQPNLTSVFKVFDLERLFNGVGFFVKIYSKMVRSEYGSAIYSPCDEFNVVYF